jgi:hypothetical protein
MRGFVEEHHFAWDASTTVIPISKESLDAAARGALAGIDVSEPDALTRIWRAFLAHTCESLDWGARFDSHPDNDVLWFSSGWAEGRMGIDVLRRVGVVKDGDYEGTILAEVRLKLVGVDPLAVGNADVEMHAEQLDEFRRAVETTPPFADLFGGRIVSAEALAFNE